MPAVTKSQSSAAKPAASRWTLEAIMPWLLLIGGLVGLAAAFILTMERFDALQNPHYRPVCNLNPIFSCSTVSSSDQASAFGFYNPFLGLAGFAVVTAFGAALLAGAKFKRWLWRLIALGLLFAVIFVSWLQFETLYRIGALCLFCMVTWLATIPPFWYTALYVLQKKYISTPRWSIRPLAFVRRHHTDVLLFWFLIIIILILKRFWYYWHTLI
jgi:uncharacterized membrane protein